MVPKNAVVPVLQGRLRGAKWVVGSCTHGCWLGSYEREKQQLFSKKTSPGQVVYDIGANVGFYTLLSSRLVGESGHVYAFEPMPRNLAYLRHHVEINRAANVTFMDTAVGEHSGLAMFREDDSPSESRLDAAGTLRVQVVALDESPALRPPDVIKMDIEGGELDALRGAMQTLRLHRPLIFLATHGERLHQECSALLTSLGYRLEHIARDEIIAS